MNGQNATRQRRYRLVSGAELCKEEKLIGYCWYKLHPGFLTAKIMKQHECLKKSCPFFEPFEEHPYLVRKRKIKERRAIAKERRLKCEQILNRFRELTAHKESFAVCRCEPQEGYYRLTCVALKQTDLRKEIRILGREQQIKISVCFINNTYAFRKMLLEKFKNKADFS